MSTTSTTTESRALDLLANGVPQKAVAIALGVTESRISQLISQDDFAAALVTKKVSNLAAHSLRDNKYDTLEDTLLSRLTDSLAMIFEPMKLVKILHIVNNAKRRGSGTPEAILEKQTVLSLNVPTLLIQNFATQTNIHNQVIQVITDDKVDQSLVTIQSKSLDALRSKYGNVKQESISLLSRTP